MKSRAIVGSIISLFLLPGPAQALRPQPDLDGLEEQLLFSAGAEENPVRTAVAVPLGTWERELPEYLTARGAILLPTQHYGTGSIVLKAERDLPNNELLRVTIFGAKEWVENHQDLRKAFEGTTLWPEGYRFGYLYLERKRVDEKTDAAFIIAMRFLPWTKQIPHLEEIAARRIAIETLGEWGKSRSPAAPVYLLGAKAAKALKPRLSDATVFWNYKYPVDPTLWHTEQVLVDSSWMWLFIKNQGPLRWYVYDGKQAGLEEWLEFDRPSPDLDRSV